MGLYNELNHKTDQIHGNFLLSTAPEEASGRLSSEGPDLCTSRRRI